MRQSIIVSETSKILKEKLKDSGTIYAIPDVKEGYTWVSNGVMLVKLNQGEFHEVFLNLKITPGLGSHTKHESHNDRIPDVTQYMVHEGESVNISNIVLNLELADVDHARLMMSDQDLSLINDKYVPLLREFNNLKHNSAKQAVSGLRYGHLGIFLLGLRQSGDRIQEHILKPLSRYIQENSLL